MLFEFEDSTLQSIYEKVMAGTRLSYEDGVALWKTHDLLGVGYMANIVRERLNGDKTYFIHNRHINPTNVCVLSCQFCAFGVKADGSTENQPFKTRWAHINWLRDTASPLNLNPEKLGSWESSSPHTKEFIKGLEFTYGSKDGEFGRGASYAIETWAAWGIGKGKEEEVHNFWKELITGIELYNERNNLEKDQHIPLDFFQFHFNSEKGHGDNVLEELRHSFYKPDFNYEKFLQGGHQALDAIYTFWAGLDKSRKNID